MCATQDATGLLEKRELAQKVQEVALQGPAGQASTSVPAGYVKDDTSGTISTQSHCEWLEIHATFSLLRIAYCKWLQQTALMRIPPGSQPPHCK